MSTSKLTQDQDQHQHQHQDIKSSTLNKSLVYCHQNQLPLKDFSDEIRGFMDIEQFAQQGQVLVHLDQQPSVTKGGPDELTLKRIVHRMLTQIDESIATSGKPSKALPVEDLMAELFVSGGSTNVLAKTIQTQEGSQSSWLDCNWLCALCELATLERRHSALATFKQPVALEPHSRGCSLLMLVVTPSKNKDTKSALEFARSFASLLALARHEFVANLINAKDDVKLRAMMVLEAQLLAQRVALDNRHHYLFDAKLSHQIKAMAAEHQKAASSAAAELRNSEPGEEKNNNQLPSSKDMSLLLKMRSMPASQQDSNAKPIAFVSVDLTADEIASSSGSPPNVGPSNSTPKPASRFGGLFSRNPRGSKLLELLGSSLKRFDSSCTDNYDDATIKTHPSKSTCDMKKDNSKRHSQQLNPMDAFKDIQFGQGICEDLSRRLPVYMSDFVDGFSGPPKNLQKTVATTWFLYFGILLPIIAFSSLNTSQTNGSMGDLRKAIVGQAIGGLAFGLLGGQPLVIIMTTAPLCLYTKVIYDMSTEYGYPFGAMYAAVGLWNGLFLAMYALLGFSKLMRLCTRSTEEIFALFIVVAFVTDAAKDLKHNFDTHYYSQACQAYDTVVALVQNVTSSSPAQSAPDLECRRDSSILFVLLMLGTLWLATTLYRFNKTPYLSATKRSLLAEYALPIAVISMTWLGARTFHEVREDVTQVSERLELVPARVDLLPVGALLLSMGLGFTLSLLFFMDQNISAAMVMAPQNNLKKASAYHWDLLMVGALNGFLTLYGFPMMHGVLPHSPLHVRSLADIEQHVVEGHLSERISNVRETRLTSIVAHLLILGSLWLLPYPIGLIPKAVLNGLFLYMAVTSLDGLQMFERILLVFTEQNNYPPNHYIRRCPQSQIHLFTALQLVQLLVMCVFGFSPFNWIEMLFPVVILAMIPFRLSVVPKYIASKSLDALDRLRSDREEDANLVQFISDSNSILNSDLNFKSNNKTVSRSKQSDLDTHLELELASNDHNNNNHYNHSCSNSR